MKYVEAKTWAEFKSAVGEFRDKYLEHEREMASGKVYKRKNPLLFRGQANACWPLNTTLERTSDKTLSVPTYMLHALKGVHEIESFSGQRWNTRDYPTVVDEIRKNQDAFRLHLPLAEYAYLVYLRHHGFPSPLLDWTESPFVAAFFAFAEARTSEHVAVYCYVEMPEGSKGGWSGQGSIYPRGPYITTHKRHFSQRSYYTIATQWDENTKEHNFISHEEVFKASSEHQDILVKISLPSKIRQSVLEELADYNINYFTLYHTEDALVRAIGMRSFEFESSAR